MLWKSDYIITISRLAERAGMTCIRRRSRKQLHDNHTIYTPTKPFSTSVHAIYEWIIGVCLVRLC